jgi:hypothetical protein
MFYLFLFILSTTAFVGFFINWIAAFVFYWFLGCLYVGSLMAIQLTAKGETRPVSPSDLIAVIIWPALVVCAFSKPPEKDPTP